jgi:hypothetical protein
MTRRKTLLSLCLLPLLASCSTPPATPPSPITPPPTTQSTDNFDESKAGHFTLPDALTLNDGQSVSDAKTWYQQRRPEILDMFTTQYYGKKPPRPDDETFELLEQSDNALGGKAIRKQIAIHFKGFTINMLMYLPAATPKPVPVFLWLSFSPLYKNTADPAVLLMDEWLPLTKTKKVLFKHPGQAADRGKSNAWKTSAVLDRGYGIAWIYYDQIDPDYAGGLPSGVRALYLKPGQSKPAPDEWGSIGAWSWGASRALDYLQIDPDVDGTRVIMMGQSRLGKTALWAGASDERFAMVIACNSGRGGASLARRNYGETIADLARNYPYQFCGNFQKYAPDPNQLPMDTHELLGLIAPRPVYLTTGSLDTHSDPHGEFLAAQAAGPIFQLLGGDPLGLETDPPLDVACFHTIAYSEHTGKHETSPWDWDRALDFADLQFKGIRPTTRLAN